MRNIIVHTRDTGEIALIVVDGTGNPAILLSREEALVVAHKLLWEAKDEPFCPQCGDIPSRHDNWNCNFRFINGAWRPV